MSEYLEQHVTKDIENDTLRRALQAQVDVLNIELHSPYHVLEWCPIEDHPTVIPSEESIETLIALTERLMRKVTQRGGCDGPTH